MVSRPSFGQGRFPRQSHSHTPRGMCVAIALLTCALLAPLHAWAQDVPEGYGDIVASFPGTVLVPPTDLAPFSSLPLTWSGSDGAGYGFTWASSGGGLARVSASFVPTAPMIFSRCSPTALYCQENTLGRDDGSPSSEVFRGMAVNGKPATVTHVTCCNGLYWMVDWTDDAQGLAYHLELTQDVAQPYGSSIRGDKRQASAVVALAVQLVPAQ